ncbi:FadR/GntR family transcriptional regulator [Kaistia sp. 32K]|uniref:FadR/GntR family transcriptional regulator n=1 Tax=Kaistia sp. 32K TaxID=2795690 RepID=UPI003530294C
MATLAKPAAAKPVRRTKPRVQKEIIASLARAIASGLYAPGSNLPRENDLCAEFGVSRTVIREALKVLESKGLVRGRPRVGTVVRDKEEWNLLDPDIVEWMGSDFLDESMLKAVLEARRAIEPAAAELAASRATAQEIADLDHAWQRMAAAKDSYSFIEADVVFHTVLLKASHNRVFAQLYGLIHAALHRALDASARAVADYENAIVAHHALVEALRMRDREGARRAVGAILDLAEHDLHISAEPE